MKNIKVEKAFCSGIAVAPAYLYNKTDYTPSLRFIEDVEKELERFNDALKAVMADLGVLAAQNEIFDAHLELAQDPELIEMIASFIRNEKRDAEWALADAITTFSSAFEALDDEYLKARAVDIRDIGGRLMKVLKGEKGSSLSKINKSTIVIAKELLPSDTAQMDFALVKGFITQEGGPTSHVAIIAKSLGIPTLVGVEGITDLVENDDLIALDAEKGEIVIAPDEETLKDFNQRIKEKAEEKEMFLQTATLPSASSDGRLLSVCANVGSLQNIKDALLSHPDGVGLFRTEFLFIDNNRLPTEDEQFEVYKQAALLLGKKELIIRTLDIGGDKPLEHLGIDPEDNPFLGYRAIRLCLDKQDIFRTQLRAILRASAFGNIKIMYPMIVSFDELNEANRIRKACMAELDASGQAYNKDINVGMMIETPASVMLADRFAEHVDFFSIGTNDLTQYILAADRGNPKIANIYDTFDPAVLKSIQTVIDAGHKAGIRVGMCGEFAGNPDALKMLLGMGLDEFSVSPPIIPRVKYMLHKSSYVEAQHIAERVSSCITKDQVKEIIKE